MNSDRYVVKLEEPAEKSLMKLDPALQATFVVVLKELETDPYLSTTGGFKWRESKAFRALKQAGYDIRILKAVEIRTWRVFFYVDNRRHLVLVKEIVPRNADTYDLRSDHVRRLKNNFREYWSR